MYYIPNSSARQVISPLCRKKAYKKGCPPANSKEFTMETAHLYALLCICPDYPFGFNPANPMPKSIKPKDSRSGKEGSSAGCIRCP